MRLVRTSPAAAYARTCGRPTWSKQLTLQPIPEGHGRGSRPSSVGYRLRNEVVANVARVGVPDRPFGRRDRHAFNTLDVLGGKVEVVDDEPLRYLPPDAHRGRQRDVIMGWVDVGESVNCQRRLVGNHTGDVWAADLRPEHGLHEVAVP